MRDRGPRRRRSRWLRILAVVSLIATIVAAGAAGCGSGSTAATAPGGAPGQISTTLSPMMEAYYRAQPGLVDGPLQPAPAAPEKILADIRTGLDPDRDVWLPEYLPDGFVLAAPYNGDGSGSAYPNPYAWGRGYSVTYTDGAGYIMVMANSDDDLAQGE